ncbi:hypothetical protein ADILRU_2274 [Leifsonia rubra CMS 76R]|nr:hypothetical protein ADILRU_2274 [Leifsonia rubra CMS 76R]
MELTWIVPVALGAAWITYGILERYFVHKERMAQRGDLSRDPRVR